MTKEGWVKRKLNGNGTPWNKGKKFPQFSGSNSPSWKGGEIRKICEECGSSFDVRQYRKMTAHFCSRSCASRFRDENKRTKEKKIRQSQEYKKWRDAVFKRDNFTCVECGDRNRDGRGSTLILQADHIKPFALFPELRLVVDNGRTLCVTCHKATGTYGRGAVYRKALLA